MLWYFTLLKKKIHLYHLVILYLLSNEYNILLKNTIFLYYPLIKIFAML